MENKKKRTKKSLEEIKIEANKYTRRSEFAKYGNAFYRAAKKREDYEEIVAHMEPSATKAYSLKEIKDEAAKYNKLSDFQKNSNGAYQTAVKRSDYRQIVAHMQEPLTLAYSLEEIQIGANKYTKRSLFKKGNSAIYNAARKRSDYEQIVAHMDVPNNKPYTLEEIKLEIANYSNLDDFYKNSPSIYGAATKLPNFKELIANLKRSIGPSLPEKTIFNVIKTIYPKTQILRDRKVKIEGKPHIRSFELDIYIPEIRKAIEFDGKYHHSFEGLKRGHPAWPDEDIKQYHEIKDQWFISKGIRVLHIKEGDWIKNKELCLTICKNFVLD